MKDRTERATWIRRWGPAVVIAVGAITALAVYHRQAASWFGLDADGWFGGGGGSASGVPEHGPGEWVAVGPLSVAAHIDPHRPAVGTNTLAVTVQTTGGEPVADARVTAVAVMPAMGAMPEMRAAAAMRHVGQGRYAGDLELTMAGAWPLTVTVESPAAGSALLRFDLSTTREGLVLTNAESDGAAVGVADAAVPAATGDPLFNPLEGIIDGPGGEIAHWTCSMHPSVKSHDAGTCPICKMDLTPVTRGELRSGVIVVDAQRRQLIGVRTGTVTRRDMNKTIRAAGLVTYDETRLADVALRYRGWIGEMFADYTGKHVREGEPLLTIYSPELLSAQQEYLQAAAAAGGSELAASVARAARDRLLLWDLTEGQIAELVERGEPLRYMPVLSPATGTIIEKAAVRGSAVEVGRMVYRIADLSTVWIEAELYENEASLVSVGQPVSVSVSYLPGGTFEGKVAYIYPYLDARTRRGRVRIEAANEDGLLKPDMYVSVSITAPLGERLAVPAEAVLHGGESDVVFVDLGEGRIRPQRVRLGVRAIGPGLGMDLIEVLEGLSAGDTVVTSGNFLIASESKLKSGIEKW